MPKKTEFVTDDELTNAVSALMDDDQLQELAALRENEVVILCCMKVVMDDDGETQPPKGCPVKLKKLSDMERLFVQGNAHYILTMDYHFWKTSNQRQQTAKLFDTLMDIKPEPTEAGLKLKKRESDVDFKHAATVGYFGAYNESTLLVRDAMKDVGRRLKDFVDDIAPEPKEQESEQPEPEAEPEVEQPEPEAEAENDAPEPVPAPKSRGKSAVKK